MHYGLGCPVSKSIFCALACNGLSIKTNKSTAPCCGLINWDTKPNSNNAEIIQSINGPEMQQLRSSLIEGVYPEVCVLCKDAENQGLNSMREIWNNYYKDAGHTDITMSAITDIEKIFAIEINTGTECNSKCMTCVPSCSNFWTDEYNSIWKTNFKNFPQTFTTKQETDQLLHMFPNLTKITFVGGEPMIGSINLNVLNFLIKTGRSKNIRLSYTTNLTGFTDDMYDLWKQFRSVNLNLSIDGYEKLNEYIRYPFKWDKIDSTLRRLIQLTDGRKLSISLSMTASAFNAHRTHELFEYWHDLVKHQPWQTGIFVNFAANPDYVSLRNLPMEYREIGVIRLKELLKKLENGNDHSKIIRAIESMIVFLQMPVLDHATKNLVALNYFIKRSDQYRNRNIKDYIPELEELLKEYATNS